MSSALLACIVHHRTANPTSACASRGIVRRNDLRTGVILPFPDALPGARDQALSAYRDRALVARGAVRGRVCGGHCRLRCDRAAEVQGDLRDADLTRARRHEHAGRLAGAVLLGRSDARCPHGVEPDHDPAGGCGRGPAAGPPRVSGRGARRRDRDACGPEQPGGRTGQRAVGKTGPADRQRDPAGGDLHAGGGAPSRDRRDPPRVAGPGREPPERITRPARNRVGPTRPAGDARHPAGPDGDARRRRPCFPRAPTPPG